MFDFLKRSRPEDTETISQSKPGFLTRLKEKLSKTRANFTAGLTTLLLGKKELDAQTLEEIETILLSADVGVDATEQTIQELTKQLGRKELSDSTMISKTLQDILQNVLEENTPPAFNFSAKPFVILLVGVNGAGKTTTIGKLANFFQQQGKSVMLAAGDTFRAAAVEQLQVWGERNQIPVIAQQGGADSASVIFDAVKSAQTKQVDILIADTAGRLHTKENLMQELQKVKRVLAKLDPTAPHETLLVLDAGIGQNALAQAEQFHAALNLSGLILTKLDGTAKGGIVFAVTKKTKLPIRFIGIGEQMDDLKPFNAQEFVTALFSE